MQDVLVNAVGHGSMTHPLTLLLAGLGASEFVIIFVIALLMIGVPVLVLWRVYSAGRTPLPPRERPALAQSCLPGERVVSRRSLLNHRTRAGPRSSTAQPRLLKHRLQARRPSRWKARSGIGCIR